MNFIVKQSYKKMGGGGSLIIIKQGKKTKRMLMVRL